MIYIQGHSDEASSSRMSLTYTPHESMFVLSPPLREGNNSLESGRDRAVTSSKRFECTV